MIQSRATESQASSLYLVRSLVLWLPGPYPYWAIVRGGCAREDNSDCDPGSCKIFHDSLVLSHVCAVRAFVTVATKALNTNSEHGHETSGRNDALDFQLFFHPET